MSDDPRSRLETFLRARRDDPSLTVVEYQPIVGGYSRAMARVWVEGDAGRTGYIVRADPPPGQAIIDTDRTTEWEMLMALQAVGTIPMPTALWFDQTGAELGSPTIVIEMIEGEALIAAARAADEAAHAEMALKMGEVGSTIHTFDVGTLPDFVERPASWDEYIDGCIQRWVTAEAEHVDANPFMRLVASWLRANKPPEAPLGLVHGDFQIANLVIDQSGTYLMVDWELAHIGDPREDLGWMQLAAVTQPPDLIAGCSDEFYAQYRERTGLSEDVINPATVAYFTVLAALTVFEPVIQQLAGMARGEAAGITVAYMSNAVAGMHGVYMNAMAAHDAYRGIPR